MTVTAPYVLPRTLAAVNCLPAATGLSASAVVDWTRV